VILKYILKEVGMRMWTLFTWLVQCPAIVNTATNLLTSCSDRTLHPVLCLHHTHCSCGCLCWSVLCYLYFSRLLYVYVLFWCTFQRFRANWPYLCWQTF
jgi:hypothetical protein